MNSKRYTYIMYTIAVVIVATIAIQFYWNYKNYQSSKKQLINDVQTSLDKAVDDYFANLAKNTTRQLYFDTTTENDSITNKDNRFYHFLNRSYKKGSDTIINLSAIKDVTLFAGTPVDSLPKSIDSNDTDTVSKRVLYPKGKAKWIKYPKGNVRIDSKVLESLTATVVFAIKNDSLDIKSIDSLVNIELNRKQINIDYKVSYDKDGTKTRSTNIVSENTKKDAPISEEYNLTHQDSSTKVTYSLSTASNSTFLPKGSRLVIEFKNETFEILKRIFAGILLSTLLVLAVISCLFYLLKIIKHQKQLAEVKNDLISNITHEFKTPIATVSVALESINNFNVIEDKEKTKKYIDMSSSQLSKLNLMVEKLLETATLDSDSLKLNKESIDIIELLTSLGNRYESQHPNKMFKYHFKVEELVANVDAFHFENALNNILDNAIKYGGDQITISVNVVRDRYKISISDNGNNLPKVNRDKIFEKFYRVPKGNTHDVKGFGIGLFYTKSIIEKHNGTITIDTANGLTTFNMNIPYG